MSLSRPTRNPVSAARQTFYTLFVVMLMGLVGGPVMISIGIHMVRRDRVSLQWPKTTGQILQWNKTFQSSRQGGSYSFAATYTYAVNHRRYVGSQIAMWEVNLESGSVEFADFAAAHPAGSPVDVYYDPQNPGNAVLIPGPNKIITRLSIIGGSITFASAIVLAIRLPTKFATYKARMELKKAAVQGE